MGVFNPQYVLPIQSNGLYTEYVTYGLPQPSDQPDIQNLITLASLMIDEYCGRTDGDGNGSLVFTTYMERFTSQSIRRNLFLIPKRPLVPLTPATLDTLAQLDGFPDYHSVALPSGSYYTGAMPSINTLANGCMSAIISASGRYAYGRRSDYGGSDAMGSFYAPLTLVTLAGGPAPWTPLDMVNLDYDPQTGNTWFAAGSSILGYNYNEIVVIYNSGYDPRFMPVQVKMACAAICKNLMAKGSGTTGMNTFTMGKSGITATFTPDVIDPNVQRLLAAFVSVRAY
jgi:hypothetical protein